MKKLIPLFLILVLFSCSEMVDFNIVNSEWEVVQSESVPAEKAYARSLELTNDVETYNEITNDNQQTLFEGEVEPPTGPATIYIIYEDTREIVKTATVERYELAAKRALYDYDVFFIERDEGRPAALFVDKVPPAPVVPVPPDPYVIYAIYVIQVNTGAIVAEEHPAEEDFALRRMLRSYDVELHNRDYSADPWALLSGYLYTAGM